MSELLKGKERGFADVRGRELDMMDYESIKKFAKRAEGELERLDVVCLNAGLMAAKFEVSRFGWERDIQVRLTASSSFTLKIPY